jgi:hypothetical protein
MKLSPSNEPQDVIEDRAWFYESRRGIELVTQVRDKEGNFISGDITRIPWGKLMRSAQRCGWKVQKASRGRALKRKGA